MRDNFKFFSRAESFLEKTSQRFAILGYGLIFNNVISSFLFACMMLIEYSLMCFFLISLTSSYDN